jgi:hypothetical protein
MADINVDDITNSGGTGVFDKLMESISGKIETEYLENRITGSEYAQVYLGGLQSALQQSMQFVMQEQLTEAQIAGVEADNLLKAKQLEVAEVERLAKVYEKDTLLVDQHNTNLKQQTLLDTQEESEQFKVNNILPAELVQLQKQTDVAERTMAEQEATGLKQRILLDTEEEAKQFEVDSILPQQLAKLQKDIDVAERSMLEQELTGSKQRVLLDTEEEGKQYEVDNLLPQQLAKLLKDIDVTERQMTETELTGIKQRILLDTEEEAKQYEVDNLLPEQLIKIQEEIDLLQSQDLAVYTDRVLKDKQAAKLGLDNVMKNAEASRTTDPNFVYTPNYE